MIRISPLIQRFQEWCAKGAYSKGMEDGKNVIVLEQADAKLTPDEEDRFVEVVLQKKDARELLERILLWKIGVVTREAMNCDDDLDTRALKKAAKKIAELTVDFKHIWERKHQRELEKEKRSLVRE